MLVRNQNVRNIYSTPLGSRLLTSRHLLRLRCGWAAAGPLGSPSARARPLRGPLRRRRILARRVSAAGLALDLALAPSRAGHLTLTDVTPGLAASSNAFRLGERGIPLARAPVARARCIRVSDSRLTAVPPVYVSCVQRRVATHDRFTRSIPASLQTRSRARRYRPPYLGLSRQCRCRWLSRRCCWSVDVAGRTTPLSPRVICWEIPC